MSNSSASPLSGVWLALRSLFWTIVLPGVRGGLLTLAFLWAPVCGWLTFAFRCDGSPCFLLASGLPSWRCAFSNSRATGRGTLAPVDPPRVLGDAWLVSIRAESNVPEG